MLNVVLVVKSILILQESEHQTAKTVALFDVFAFILCKTMVTLSNMMPVIRLLFVARVGWWDQYLSFTRTFSTFQKWRQLKFGFSAQNTFSWEHILVYLFYSDEIVWLQRCLNDLHKFCHIHWRDSISESFKNQQVV